MLGTIQSMGTYTIANKFKKRIPNSITDLSLSNYSIVYQNDCNSLSNLTVNNNGVTVVNGTYSAAGTGTTYGAINTGISLLNKTITVDISSNLLAEFYFGCDSSGSGYMIRFETRPDSIVYISYMAAPTSWTNRGYWVDPTEPSTWTIITGPAPAGSANDTSRRLQASVWYTIIMSIASDGTLSWAAQKQGTPTFINNTTYPQYTNFKVSDANRFIAVNGAGGNGRSQFDNIKIYNQALYKVLAES